MINQIDLTQGTPLSDEQLRERIRALRPWQQNLNLNGVWTAPTSGENPEERWARIVPALPADLSGMSVLEVGCGAGFHALALKERGAARVVGIDSDERSLEQARLAAQVRGLPLELHRLSAYQVARLGERFDLVVFMGVFDHLRHPLLALDLLHEHAVKDLLLFQVAQRGSRTLFRPETDYEPEEAEVFAREGYPVLHFVEHEYGHDWTHWWLPNRSCTEALLRASGFEVVAQPDDEVYLCRRKELGGAPRAAYPERSPGRL